MSRTFMDCSVQDALFLRNVLNNRMKEITDDEWKLLVINCLVVAQQMVEKFLKHKLRKILKPSDSKVNSKSYRLGNLEDNRTIIYSLYSKEHKLAPTYNLLKPYLDEEFKVALSNVIDKLDECYTNNRYPINNAGKPLPICSISKVEYTWIITLCDYIIDNPDDDTISFGDIAYLFEDSTLDIKPIEISTFNFNRRR